LCYSKTISGPLYVFTGLHLKERFKRFMGTTEIHLTARMNLRTYRSGCRCAYSRSQQRWSKNLMLKMQSSMWTWLSCVHFSSFCVSAATLFCVGEHAYTEPSKLAIMASGSTPYLSFNPCQHFNELSQIVQNVVNCSSD